MQAVLKNWVKTEKVLLPIYSRSSNLDGVFNPILLVLADLNLLSIN